MPEKHLVAQDIADATLFLSSAASRIMTGQGMAPMAALCMWPEAMDQAEWLLWIGDHPSKVWVFGPDERLLTVHL